MSIISICMATRYEFVSTHRISVKIRHKKAVDIWNEYFSGVGTVPVCLIVQVEQSAKP
jgi:hypothetical protein